MPIFHRIGHLLKTPEVKVGQWVKRGQLLGYCGSTGASTGAHAHYDVFNTDRLGWTFYVRYWPLAKVKSIFVDPNPYIKDGFPMVRNLPKIGFHYLQGVRERGRVYYHPGEDLNSVNDLGKPVYSPVEGRVRCVLGASWLGKIWSNYNSGWGCMVVIEEAPKV